MAGVFNQYYRQSVLRDHLPEVDRGLRNMFNFKGHRGAKQYYSPDYPYKCHYDPDVYYDEYPSFKYPYNILSDLNMSEKRGIRKGRDTFSVKS